MSYCIGQGWEHDLDRYLTEDPRDAEKPVEICAECKEGIYEDEMYYRVDGKAYCERCMENMRVRAEEVEW